MRWFLPAALAAAVVVLPAEGQQPAGKTPNPPSEIGGRTLAQWIADISSKDRSKSERAIQTVVLFGPAAKVAVPTLVAELKKHRPASGVFLDLGVRTYGVAALGTLVPCIEDTNAKEVQEAIALLITYLKDNQILVRFRTVQAISNLGPAAHAAIPEIIALTKDVNSWEVRQSACIALGMMVPIVKDKGPDNPNALKALFVALDDSSSQVKIGAIQALERLGAGQFAALRPTYEKELEQCLSDTDKTVRIRAHLALYGLDKRKDASRRNAIGSLLETPDSVVKAEAAMALGAIGADAVDQLPKLVAGFRDRDPVVAVHCIAAVSRMEIAAQAALPDLQKLTADVNVPEVVRDNARAAMDYLNGKKTYKTTKGAGQ